MWGNLGEGLSGKGDVAFLAAELIETDEVDDVALAFLSSLRFE